MAEAGLREDQQERDRESNLIHEDAVSINSKTSQLGPEDDLVSSSPPLQAMAWYSRKRRYPGALLFNVGSFLLPALYGTLSKMWVAGIDSSLVSTTDAYTYLLVVVEVFNEGLPKAVWSTIANSATNDISTRLSLTLTLITVQSALGFILSLSFLAAAPRFVGVFVPGPAKATSIRYIRISSFSSLASTVETAVSLGTRALDQPDVPLVISTVKISLQIILELALISTVHVRGFTPTIEVQATIRLVCDLVGAFVGLLYFLSIVRKTRLRMNLSSIGWFSFSSLKVLARPGSWTFLESAVRNIIYLYLISGVVAMGQNYATAWGAFNTMRWGLIMVPVQALEATSNAFVGHRWGMWLAKPWEKATRRDIWCMYRGLISLHTPDPLQSHRLACSQINFHCAVDRNPTVYILVILGRRAVREIPLWIRRGGGHNWYDVA